MATRMDLLNKVGSIGCKLALWLAIVAISASFGFAQRVVWLNVPTDYIMGDYDLDYAISNDGKTVLLSVREGADDEGEYDLRDYWFEIYRVNQGLVYRSPRGFRTGNKWSGDHADANGMSQDGNYVVGSYSLPSSFDERAFVFSLQRQQFTDLTEWVNQFISGWWQEEGNYLNLLSADVVSLKGRYFLGRFSASSQEDGYFSGVYWLSPYGVRLLRDPEGDWWNPSSLSPDGNVCIVTTTFKSLRWVPLSNSFVYLEIPPLGQFLSRTISWYGRTVAGTSLGSLYRPFRWDTADPLGASGRVTRLSEEAAYIDTVSATGRVLIGTSYISSKVYRWVRYSKEDLPPIDVREELDITYRGVLSLYNSSKMIGRGSVGLLEQDSRDARDAQHIIGIGINPSTQQLDLFVLDTCSNPPQLGEFLKTLMLPFASKDGQSVGWEPSTYDQHGKRCADDKGLYAVDFNLLGSPQQDCGEIVVAAHSGYVYYQVLPGYGNLAVVIANDVESQRSDVYVATLYAHLKEKNPSLHGKWVCAGTPIGTVGSTGRSTAPHLHFQICYFRHSPNNDTVIYEDKSVGYNGKIQIVNNPNVLLSGQQVIIPPERRRRLSPHERCPNLPRYSYHGSLLYTTAPEIPAGYIDLYGCQSGDTQWLRDGTCCGGHFGDGGDEDLGSHGDWSVDDADVYILLTDLDANGCVDDSDLLSLLFAFGSEGTVPGDINWDLVVDADDLVLLLQDFGLGCE